MLPKALMWCIPMGKEMDFRKSWASFYSSWLCNCTPKTASVNATSPSQEKNIFRIKNPPKYKGEKWINWLKCISRAEHWLCTTQSPSVPAAPSHGHSAMGENSPWICCRKNSGLGNICAPEVKERCREGARRTEVNCPLSGGQGLLCWSSSYRVCADTGTQQCSHHPAHRRVFLAQIQPRFLHEQQYPCKLLLFHLNFMSPN